MAPKTSKILKARVENNCMFVDILVTLFNTWNSLFLAIRSCFLQSSHWILIFLKIRLKITLTKYIYIIYWIEKYRGHKLHISTRTWQLCYLYIKLLYNIYTNKNCKACVITLWLYQMHYVHCKLAWYKKYIWT